VAKRIAEEHRIPPGYLLKVLQQLVRGHILDSVRGPQGGFVLARPAEDMSLLDIVEAIEGTLTTTWTPLRNTNGHFHQALRARCRCATEQASRVLAETSLAQLLEGSDGATGHPGARDGSAPDPRTPLPEGTLGTTGRVEATRSGTNPAGKASAG